MSKTVLRSLNMSIPTLRCSSYNWRSPDCMDEPPRYDYTRKWAKTVETGVHLNTFKLLSYNILAQDLLIEHLNLYENVDRKWLNWRQRLQNLQKELLKLDADILCLQEMQYDHLPTLVKCLTASSGKRLEYIYKKKTGDRTDGCAIIYDSCKFQLLRQRAVELYDMHVPLLNRHNVALLAQFRVKQRLKNSSSEIIIATTHLLFNPKRSDVRCAQVDRLLVELRCFMAYGDAKEAQQPPVILTGDLNSEIDSQPLALLTNNTDESLLTFETLDPGECTASTYQDNWITVDYILRSLSPHLKVLGVYNLPTINTCANVGSIPNHYLGSDHYALGALFGLD